MARKRKKTQIRRTKQRPPTPTPQSLFPALQPPHRKWDSIGLSVLFLAAFALFAASAARTIILEDDGLFVSTAWFAGVPHPPGYPLYTILGWLSAHLLPFSEIPWRVHIVSGWMAAVTCVCIAWLVLRRTGNRPAAYLAGAALAVSEHFWSQAIIADVYTTNTALLFLTLVMVQEAVARRDTRFWLAAAFLYGLGLANHWPLLILASPIFIAYVLASGKEFWGKLHYLAFCALVPAALLYGWLAWRSHQAPLLNFLGPIESLEQMISFIRRDIFAGADSKVTADLVDKIYYVRYFITEGMLQLSLPGGLLALWGVYHTFRNGWRAGCYSEIACLCASSFLLIALLGFDYEHFRIAVFRPYPLVGYCILALWLGYGIHALMQLAGERRRLLLPILCGGFGLIILALGVWNGRTNYRANDRFSEQYAQNLFDIVEENAILVPHGDAYVMSTVYYQLVEGRRPDIRLLVYNGLFVNDRIVQPLWSDKRKEEVWREFVKNTDRPFYYQAMGKYLREHLGQASFGFVNKVSRDIAPKKVKLEFSEPAKTFFKKMIELPPTRDRWIIRQRNIAIRSYAQYLGYAMVTNHAKMEKHIEDVLPLAENNYWGLVGLTLSLVAQDPKHLPLAEKYLAKAIQMVDEDQGVADAALLPYLQGRIAEQQGNVVAARDFYKQSLAVNPSKENTARSALEKL